MNTNDEENDFDEEVDVDVLNACIESDITICRNKGTILASGELEEESVYKVIEEIASQEASEGQQDDTFDCSQDTSASRDDDKEIDGDDKEIGGDDKEIDGDCEEIDGDCEDGDGEDEDGDGEEDEDDEEDEEDDEEGTPEEEL